MRLECGAVKSELLHRCKTHLIDAKQTAAQKEANEIKINEIIQVLLTEVNKNGDNFIQIDEYNEATRPPKENLVIQVERRFNELTVTLKINTHHI